MTRERDDADATEPKRLMEGSEAIAEAAIAVGCRFFSGYPMTPFTEVLESFAKRLPEEGGACINAESELEAIGQAWGAAATGARAATGSTGQGLSLMQESMSEITRAEIPIVIFNMARGQGDYFQATRGGGHGDYRHIVLAPESVGEAVELTQLAFHLSDRWRHPVVIYGDYLLSHTAEAVEIQRRSNFGALPDKDWAVDGSLGGTGRSRNLNPIGMEKGSKGIDPDALLAALCGQGRRDRRRRDALRGRGTGRRRRAAGRRLRHASPASRARAMRELRAEGLQVGLFRPITLWPFPKRGARRGGRRLRNASPCSSRTPDR